VADIPDGTVPGRPKGTASSTDEQSAATKRSEGAGNYDSVVFAADLRQGDTAPDAATADRRHAEAASGARPHPLDKVEAEHFRRTLIAPMRPRATTAEQMQVNPMPEGVQIATRRVSRASENPRLHVLDDPDSPQAASYRVLRYRLSERGNPRVVVVTSPNEADGKTTCAINLAAALSECGRARVLLFEANLRRPGIAAALGMRPPRCAGVQLAEHHAHPNVNPWQVAQLDSPWLHVLAIEPKSFEQPLTIDEPAFANALGQLRDVGYDYIVLDTPPVLGTADVNLLQQLADGVLLTVWARRSSSRALKQAIDQLTPAKIVGVALLDAH
jgi:Mrp family chromosome partitioning ATPase